MLSCFKSTRLYSKAQNNNHLESKEELILDMITNIRFFILLIELNKIYIQLFRYRIKVLFIYFTKWKQKIDKDGALDYIVSYKSVI